VQSDFESPKQHKTTTRRLVTLAAVAAITVGGAAACASTTASAKPSSVGSSAVAAPNIPIPPSATGSPSIQPGGPMIPVPSSPGPGSGTGSGTGAGPAAPTFKGTGYTADGERLTVDFFAGICDKYGLKANESTPGRVVVTIVVTQYPQQGQRCPMLVKEQQVSATLAAPLDGRAVVDSSTGTALPQVNTSTGTKYYSPGPVKIGASTQRG